jgi:hypothetical protein
MQPTKDIVSARKTGLGLTLREMTWVGKVFYKSGMFTDTRDEAVAIVKIMAGQEMGLAPFESMTGINIIKVRPTLAAATIGAKIKASKKYDYRVKVATEEKSQVDFYEIENGKRTHIGTSTYTIEQARKAGLLEKDNWKNYPEDMLFARNISRGSRRYTPDVFSTPIYTAEELEEESPGGLSFIPADGGHKALPSASNEPPVDAPPEDDDNEELDDSVAESPAAAPKEELPPPEPIREFDDAFMQDVELDLLRLELNDIELKRFIRNITGKITTKNLTQHQWRELKDAVDKALVERQEQQSLNDLDQDG